MSAEEKKTEELIGQPSEKRPPKQTVQDDLLGRPHTAEKSFAVDTRPSGETRFVTETPEERFAELQRMTSSYLAPEEEALLLKAFEFASEAHKGVCRKSGEPYIIHPVEVAIILADLRMDVETLIAALLHDTIEDTDVTDEVVTDLFGAHVDQLVDGVTKITRIEVDNLSDKQAATIRKMFVAMSRDIRVIVIKLADRLHNMRTLAALAEDRRIFKSRETLEIYAPIAHRLGINSIKWELEDLSFYYLEPNKYKQVARMVMESRAEREAYLSQVIDTLREEMDRVHIQAQVMGRPKHLYSIYQKMTKKGKGFSEIYDLIAVRLIVKTVNDCYSALGAVHTLWHPMPGRFKDYIAMPKFNMYQSLHTTVIGPAGNPFEVQIRTEEMHRMDEYGVAAHWRYKEGAGKKSDAALDQQLAIFAFLAPNEVFVFTPKGEAMSLRAGSTPVDFAYSIHTEVGNHCVGAKVNNIIVPLTYELQTGDRVEILTQKSASPSRDWLNFVKTPSARSKIRSYFSKVSRGDDLQEGRDKLTREMRKHGLGISNTNSMRAMKTVAEHMGYKDSDDMLVNIGTGRESAQHVANRLLKILVDKGNQQEEGSFLVAGTMSTGKMPPMLTTVRQPKKHETHSSNGVVVKGVEDVLVRLSRCCNPVPGDEIIGFVTRGRGVSVHRADCPNAEDLKRDPERIIDVEWESEPAPNTSYQVEVLVEALDRMNLLLDVTTVISGMGANVLSSSLNVHRDGVAEMRFLFQVSDTHMIDLMLEDLKAVEGVFDARRMLPGEGSGKKRK